MLTSRRGDWAARNYSSVEKTKNRARRSNRRVGALKGMRRGPNHAPYCCWYPHLFTGPTVQQPVCKQASYRLWQTGCLPQCDRACEQVSRSWADASPQEIATNGVQSMATRTVPKTKCAMTTSPTHVAAPKSYGRIPERTTDKFCPSLSAPCLICALG